MNPSDFVRPFDNFLKTRLVAPAKKIKKSKQPSSATMMRWMENGVAKATDGCRIEPDGTCPHGCHSWLVVLGLI